MKLSLTLMTLAAGLIASAVALAQAPSSAPAGSTGMCKDGSYTSNATKKGACAGHKGVKDWYIDSAANTAKTTAPAAAPMATGAAATDKTVTPVPMAAPAKKATSTSPAGSAPAAGGGSGQVWVNSSTKVYHCPGTKYYGKTKQGQYMTEAAAIAAGNHADHGKSCTAK
jgi:Protein of unknown function (DUF3761)